MVSELSLRPAHRGSSAAQLVLALGALGLVSPNAFAQDVSGAATAFRRAQQAQLQEDHPQAAEFYEMAHDMAPSAQALRSAMRERQLAGHDAIAATHALALLSDYGSDPENTQRANRVLTELRPRLLLVSVECEQVECTVQVDGSALGTSAARLHEFFVGAGDHSLVATMEGRETVAQQFEGSGGESRELTFRPRPVRDDPSEPAGSDDVTAPTVRREADNFDPRVDEDARRGITPVVFGIGMAVTAVLGGVAIWSGVDTRSEHDDYQTAQMTGASFAQLEAAYDDGLRLQRRTNALLGAAGAVGLGTLVIAIFTDWGGSSNDEPQEARLQVDAGLGSVVATIQGSFQ